MKNVTKILTTVVLCAAVFASTERTNALGGNAAFWPGDEANISAFPAQINNHAFVQVTGIEGAGAGVDMVFGHGGHNWSLGFSNSANTWFDLGWGNQNGMGFNLAYTNSDDGNNTTSNGMVLSFGKDLGDIGEIGFIMVSGSDDTYTAGYTITNDDAVEAVDAFAGYDPTPDYSPEVGTADTMNCGDGTMPCGNASVDACTAPDGSAVDGLTGEDCTNASTSSCSDGASGDEATCLAPGTCSDGAAADKAACELVELTAAVPGSCDDGVSLDETACTTAGGVWTAEVPATFHTWTSTNTWDTVNDGNTWTDAWADQIGHPGMPATPAVEGSAATTTTVAAMTNSADWAHNGITLNFRRACGFWVFTDMVASLNSPSEGDMSLDVDWFGHMDAGAADVMLAMGFEYDAADSGIRQTANLGVETAITDNVTLRGGMAWGYDLSNDGETSGATDYAWSTGAGVNFGSFTADVALGQSFWENPMGWLSGNDDDSSWGSITATYNF